MFVHLGGRWDYVGTTAVLVWTNEIKNTESTGILVPQKGTEIDIYNIKYWYFNTVDNTTRTNLLVDKVSNSLVKTVPHLH